MLEYAEDRNYLLNDIILGKDYTAVNGCVLVWTSVRFQQESKQGFPQKGASFVDNR
jgi:hypothetical protein